MVAYETNSRLDSGQHRCWDPWRGVQRRRGQVPEPRPESAIL